MANLDSPRLIEVAFPLKQASLDSVHEKNVRHGHISTLHIWPARRPLAACRAALIATLLPDPGNAEERRLLLEKLAGKVVNVVKKVKLPSGKTEEKIAQETVGGILHWGRESNPDLEWFRHKIKEAYGGRAPRVLDPFAGGGAIPLEAMRLGCEVTAMDINPVAWFILKCTLEYPQKLAGQHRPLPQFALRSREFMEGFFKGTSKLTKKQLERNLQAVQEQMFPPPDVDLAWHVRAWGKWVLDQARRDLARFYPTYADFESPLKSLFPSREASGEDSPPGRGAGVGWHFDAADPPRKAAPSTPPRRGFYGPREPRLAPLKADGTLDLAALNAEFSEDYLKDPRNPRWVPKSTVAYLWARTVKCKNCRAEIPLLKTRWLCKKDSKRVLLSVTPKADKTGVVFGIKTDVPVVGGNSAQRREHDKKIGQGSMSRNGAWCSCCGQAGTVAMQMEDIRQEGMAGRLAATMTAVVVDGSAGKEYRLPRSEEVQAAKDAHAELGKVFAEIPFGLPEEPLPSKEALGFRVPLYGFDKWHKLFTSRQLLGIMTLVRYTRDAFQQMYEEKYPTEWIHAVASYLALSLDRVAERNSSICHFDVSRDSIAGTFQRYALPINWDFCEAVPTNRSAGGYDGQTDWVARYLDHAAQALQNALQPVIDNISATSTTRRDVDVVITDPPYYDAIPYSDLMDFFYIWLRRTLFQLTPDIDRSFAKALGPKWNHDTNDGELIDDASRFGGNRVRSKAVYEDGMYRSFLATHESLRSAGRLVIVFAHKHPDAWETLVSAIIRAGFVVDGSWPIQTEMGNRTRALSSAALSSSVWLVCKKRPETAKPGWDNRVLEEMREKIGTKLREFWDAGIRGPDFVWAATGPALEAYSQHPAVKKANVPNQLMTVTEFLQHVRRMVVDFVVGQVLSHNGNAETVTGLDEVTTYYLLHRHDFGMEEAPIGACILYAVSCGLSDRALTDQFDILARAGKHSAEDDEDEEETELDNEGEAEETTGSKVKLKPWQQRKGRSLGYEASGGRAVPLIDQIHRLMHLWKAGDVVKVDEYLDSKGLRRNALFHQLLQALIELSAAGSEERSLIESISNHVAARGIAKGAHPSLPGLEVPVSSMEGGES